MLSKDEVLAYARQKGRADALDLRTRAAGMDGTAIIAEEGKAPAWSADRDYTGWPVGGPVAYNGQVYKLLQPHNAVHYPDSTPANTPALWSITHTTDPVRAKPWAAPNGTSGLYMTGECCAWEGGVYRCLQDDTVHDPGALPEAWKAVSKDTERED